MKKCERDELILSALISNPTTRAAATACNMSETQIYERLRDPKFRARYDSARLELLQDTTATLQKSLCGAVEEMRFISMDRETPAQTRLNACTALIRSSIRLTEQTEVLQRLAKLENTINHSGKDKQ